MCSAVAVSCDEHFISLRHLWLSFCRSIYLSIKVSRRLCCCPNNCLFRLHLFQFVFPSFLFCMVFVCLSVTSSYLSCSLLVLWLSFHVAAVRCVCVCVNEERNINTHAYAHNCCYIHTCLSAPRRRRHRPAGQPTDWQSSSSSFLLASTGSELKSSSSHRFGGTVPKAFSKSHLLGLSAHRQQILVGSNPRPCSLLVFL